MLEVTGASVGVGDVGLPGVEGVGVPEGEASLPCLLRLHPLQPGPARQKCLYRIFCDPNPMRGFRSYQYILSKLILLKLLIFRVLNEPANKSRYCSLLSCTLP